MQSISLPGKRVLVREGADLPSQLRDILDVSVHATSLGTSRDSDGDGRTQVSDLADDDIVEIQLEGGLKLWQSVEATRDDFANATRSVADQTLLVPRTLPIGDVDRAGGGYAVQAVKILKGKFAGEAGKWTARAVAEHIESALKPGLYRCTRDDSGPKARLKLSVPDFKDHDPKARMLVLVHGTFSSTEGSFSDLASTGGGEISDLWASLEAAFPGGIHTLEHKTVTVDPIANALELVLALPDGAHLSMLSYSRGGLVAELVARAARTDIDGGAFDATDLALFAGKEAAKTLKALNAAIAAKGITVDRVIRVAAPLRGTSLASGRLDRALSVALNTFELMPVLKTSVAYDLLKAFLLGFVKAKGDPATLPGLEAMMPTSALVKMLNRPDVTYSGDLHIVEGDNEGSGLFQRLRNLAVDLFFQDDNDFVVNTASMSKGAVRQRPPVVTNVTSPEITHFTYFQTGVVRSAIVAARSAGPAIANGAGPDLRMEDAPGLVVSRARDAANLPVCIFLPGIMGTHLNHQKDGADDSDWIWSNPFRMATGGLARLRMPGKGVVTPGSPMDRYYGDLARYLSRDHDVILFPYDWRDSVLVTGAKALSEVVAEALDKTDQPIRFLAHSMGGLVVRAFIDAHPDLWARIKSRAGSRFVMLGTPNGGAFSMAHTLMGRAKSIQQLAALDLKHSKTELLEIVTSMPGPAQLLPADENGHFLDRDTWQELRHLDDGQWVVPSAGTFAEARQAHALFKRQTLDPDLTCYVAGLGEDPTPSGIQIDQTASARDKVKFLGTYAGDGTVTWDKGIPDGIPTFYMEAVHGDMARTTQAFPAIADLMERGETSALSTDPPAMSRGVARDTVVAERGLDMYPEPEDILLNFMGAGRRRKTAVKPAIPRTQVKVIHGDLRYARHPVLVGHYMGEPIAGSHAALDQCLDHHLTKVRDMGLYPGEIETCEVVLRLDRNPGGAVVAGLGRFGDLTPGELRKTVNRAVLRYALNLQRRATDKGLSLSEMEPISLTSLVIGNQGANMTVQQSVQSILEAVADANLTLGETPIAHLEFIEIFEDTAFKTASALHSASENGQVAGQFDFNDRIETGAGARLRMDFGTEPDTWQRITVSINEDEPDVLRYTAISHGAKAEFQKTAVQSEVIDRLLKESRQGTATMRNLGKLLFELMIPTALKSFAQNDQKIQLVLDKSTSHIPWELMEDDVSTFGEGLYQSTHKVDFKPLVIRTPIVRQLVTPGTTVPRATENTVLVVGDPKTTHHAPLPGARAEAALVAKRLDEAPLFSGNVKHLDQPANGFTVLESVMLSPYKILHIAAHGVYDDTGPTHRAGLVLSDGVHLTSAELHSMRYVPEFVFLNCCHIGRAEGNTGVIAASLSETLIQKGVRAVIAAGWAVDDRAADLFASEFYDSMLGGNSFGDAVHHARITVFARFGEKNTWGAYQCYGDPNYRFEDQQDDSGTNRLGAPTRYYSADHARKAAINIVSDASSPHCNRDDLLAQLDAIHKDADPDWHADAAWTEAMGRAYAELDVYGQAIDFLERAKQLSGSGATISALELQETLKVRARTYDWTTASYKARIAPAQDKARADATAKIARDTQRETAKAALDVLNTLDELTGSTTAQREVLKGTVTKRLVLTATRGRSRQAYLNRMIQHYKNAMDAINAHRPDERDLHPMYNWLSGRLVLADDDAEAQSLDIGFAELLALNARREESAPGFWSAAKPGEVDILKGLLAPPDQRDEIFHRLEATFRYAWDRGGAFGQARSIREHIHFLKAMYVGVDDSKAAWMSRVQTFMNDLTWTYRDDRPDRF